MLKYADPSPNENFRKISKRAAKFSRNSEFEGYEEAHCYDDGDYEQHEEGEGCEGYEEAH